MASEALAPANWDDMVFENRHRTYGAYAIRQAYAGHLVVSFIMAVAVIGLASYASKFLPACTSTFLPVPPVADNPGGCIFPILPIEPPLPIRIVKELKSLTLTPRVTHNEVFIEALADENPPVLQKPEPPVEVIPVAAKSDITETPVDSTIFCPVGPPRMADYREGMEALTRYLKNKLRYPADARRDGIEGAVLIGFTVSHTGEITDVKVLRGIHPDCDNEALRVVTNMPTWNAAQQNGHPVAIRMVLPIKFELQY